MAKKLVRVEGLTYKSSAKEIRKLSKEYGIKWRRGYAPTDERWEAMSKPDRESLLMDIAMSSPAQRQFEEDWAKALDKHPELHTFGGFCEILFDCDVNGKPLKKKKK